MSDEGLVEPNEDVRGSARVLALGVTALFLVVLGGTLVVDLVWPAPPIRLVGQEEAAAARARKERAWSDGSGARWVEKELELRSRVRRTLAPWWAAVLVRYARTGTRDAIVGEGDWLFLRPRVTPPDRPTSELVAPAVNTFAAFARRLASQGTELVAVPVPRKAVVCRSKLPAGVDPRADHDHRLLAELARRGVARVDLLAAWADLAPEALYLRQDSHWALDAQLAAARACLALRPALQRAEFEVELARVELGSRAGNLDFVGVPVTHPAYAWLARPHEEFLLLQPRALEERFRSFRAECELALVGTSFSRDFDFPKALFALARRDLLNASYPGVAFGEPLARLLFAGQASTLPRTIFYEWPMHQAWAVWGHDPRACETVGQVFLLAEQGATSPLGGEPADWLSCPAQTADGARAHDADRGVVSSGEGLVMLQATLHGAPDSRWRFECAAFKFGFKWPSDGRTLHLPVLEQLVPSGRFMLRALDERGKAASLECAVVTDLDLARGNAGEALEAPLGVVRRRYVAADAAGVGGPGAGLAVQLGGVRGAKAVVEVEAIAAGGEARVWTFDGGDGLGVRGGALVLVGLGDLATAPDLTVEVRTGLPVDTVTLAPTAWPR